MRKYLILEDRFKDPNDPLQLVFVCAMWLTGFDVKSLSSVYLDKPMKGHTLMQAIARANRVFPGKTCGIIVDYVNVFKYMKKALSDYASGDNGDDFPAKDIDQLIYNIDNCIDETDAFLKAMDIDLNKIIAEASTFDKLDDLRAAYNKITSIIWLDLLLIDFICMIQRLLLICVIIIRSCFQLQCILSFHMMRKKLKIQIK